MLLKFNLYLDFSLLSFGRGYKDFFFLLGRKKLNIPEPNSNLTLCFSLFWLPKPAKTVRKLFGDAGKHQENIQLTWVCEATSVFEHMGGKKVGVSVFFLGSVHQTMYGLTFSPT